MIKFEHTMVMGFEGAIRGMRNPLNSWSKSDSCFCYTQPDCESCCEVHIGPNDLRLAQGLIRGGSEHRKFLRQIFISVDITAPLYYFKEFDTYKVGTAANSTSTMHRIAAKEFSREDFSHEHLDSVGLATLDRTIEALNQSREIYLNGGLRGATYYGAINKTVWWQMIQLLPSSYNQTRTITMSYENVYTMVRQRRGHKLDEWRIGFMEWARSLPYAQELIFLDELQNEEQPV